MKDYPLSRANLILGLCLIASAYFGSGLSYGKVYLFHLILPVFLGALVVNYFRDRQKVERLVLANDWSIYDFFIPLSILWFLLSLLWAESDIHAFKYLIFLGFGSLIFFTIKVLFKHLKWQKTLLIILGLCVGLETILWLVEFTTSFKWFVSIASPYLSDLGRTAFNPDLYAEEDLENLLKYPSGFQWNPNNLALIFALTFPFLFFSKYRLVSILGSAVCILVIFSTGSRISVLALILGIVFMASVLNKRLIVNYLLVILCLLILSTNFFSEKSSQIVAFKEIQLFTDDFIPFHRFEKEERKLTKRSDEIREILILDGLEAFKRSYGLGVGAGNDIYLQEKKGGVGTKKVTVMHNFWMELLVNGGIVIAFIWGAWYIRTLNLLWRRWKQSEGKYYYVSVMTAMVILLLGAASPSSCIYFLPMYILLGWGNQLSVAK